MTGETENLPKHPRRRWLYPVCVLLLLMAALLLRTWGIGWGLPHAGRYYPYHPDEAVLLFVLGQVNPLWLDFTPTFYNYGTLYILLSRLAYDFTAPVAGWGAVPQAGPFTQWVADLGHLLWVSRWVTALLGAGTVGLVLSLGRTLYSARAGWLAAGFLAVAPLAVMLGHYMTVDVPATFFTTLTLVAAAQALRAQEARRVVGWLLAGAAAAGLAVGTKYNAFPAAFALAVPLWQLFRGEVGGRRPALVALPACMVVCVGAFLVATPGAVLETPRFLADLAYEMGRNREGQGLIFQETPPTLLYHLGISFPVALEWPLYLLALGGLAWAMYRRGKADLLLLLFLLPFFLLLLPAERKFLRYITPMVPVLVLLAARMVDEGLSTPRARLWTGLGVLAGVAACASTVAHLGVLTAPDARDQAAAHLRSVSRPDDVVALGSDAWYYTPPVHPTAGSVKLWALPYGGPPAWDPVEEGVARPDLFAAGPYQVLAPRSHPSPAGALPGAKLREHRPARVVLTDYEYEDPVRVRNADPSFQSGVLDLMEALEADYRIEREFRPRPALLGFTWWRRGIPPHDWRYYMPTVRVYVRKDLP